MIDPVLFHPRHLLPRKDPAPQRWPWRGGRWANPYRPR